MHAFRITHTLFCVWIATLAGSLAFAAAGAAASTHAPCTISGTNGPDVLDPMDVGLGVRL